MTRLQDVRASIDTRRKVLFLLAAGAASAGCAAKVVPFAKVDDQLMARWNEVADGNRVQTGDFHWSIFDQFPHPTYKGGSAEAYRTFAEILVAFFEEGDNFDYLAKNRLFSYPLKTALGRVFTFANLTETLLAGAWIGLSSDLLLKLQDFDNRIRAVG